MAENIKILYCKFSEGFGMEKQDFFDISTDQKEFAAYHYLFRKLKRNGFFGFIQEAHKKDIGFGSLTKDKYDRWKRVNRSPSLKDLKYFVRWAWRSQSCAITSVRTRKSKKLTYFCCREFIPKIISNNTTHEVNP